MKRSLLISVSLVILCFLLFSCGKTRQKENAQDTSSHGSESAAASETSSGGSEPSSVPSVNTKPSVDPPVTAQSTPIIRIHTENGAEIPTDKSKINCTVTLESNLAAYCAELLYATIRCRGNGSMSVGKSTGKFPYKLEFTQDINPFGVGDGEADEWVLLAHVGDQSMLRNYAAKLMGDLLSGIPYSTNARLVNVYLNDAYIGVYELTEQVEVGKYRVKVDDETGNEEVGFLVELDEYADDIYVRVDGEKFTVKSEVYSDAQLSFIQGYLQDVNDAIFDGDKDALSKLVDMDSLIDMYLLQEFAKNIDAGWSSFFMYRDVGGKLYFSPPWDFDLAFGNDDRLDNGSYEDLYIGTGRLGYAQNHVWYNQLYTFEWFRDMAAERWQEISGTVIPKVIQAVRAAASSIAKDMNENYKIWNFIGHRQQQEPRAITSLKTYGEHVDYLINWMENRKAWLDAEFSK